MHIIAHGTLCQNLRSISFLHFHLICGNHYRKVGFHCRHSQIVSRAEIKLGDKLATDPCSNLEYFAGKSPNFAIAPIPEISEKIQIYGGHTCQIGFTEFRKFTENWHP